MNLVDMRRGGAVGRDEGVRLGAGEEIECLYHIWLAHLAAEDLAEILRFILHAPGMRIGRENLLFRSYLDRRRGHPIAINVAQTLLRSFGKRRATLVEIAFGGAASEFVIGPLRHSHVDIAAIALCRAPAIESALPDQIAVIVPNLRDAVMVAATLDRQFADS